MGIFLPDVYLDINKDAGFCSFQERYPNWRDFWQYCSRADWMLTLCDNIESSADEYTRQSVLYDNHVKFWNVYKELLRFEKGRERGVTLHGFPEETEVDAHLQSIDRTITATPGSARELRTRSWIKLSVYLPFAMTEVAWSVGLCACLLHTISASLKQREQTDATISYEDKARIQAEADMAKDAAIVEFYQQQAIVMRRLIGNPFD